MKISKFLFIFVFSLVLISSIGLADKVEIVQKDGILISDVNQDYIEEGENYTFDFHLEKLQDGTAISDNNTECYFNLYGKDGKLIHYGNLSYEPDGARNNWEIEVSGDLLDIGQKRYLVQCTDDLNQIGGSRSESIEVTPTGHSPTIPQAIIYVSLILTTLVFLIISIYGSIRIKWENNKDARDDIIGINELKYAKIGLIFVSYLLFLFLFAIGKDVTQSYLFLSGAYSLFNVGFTILLIGLAPVLIATVALIIIGIISDKEIQEAISRGIDPEHLRRGK